MIVVQSQHMFILNGINDNKKLNFNMNTTCPIEACGQFLQYHEATLSL